MSDHNHTNGTTNGNGIGSNGVQSHVPNGAHINGTSSGLKPNGISNGTTNGINGHAPSTAATQTPVAVVGLACRLPGKSNSPEALWKFLLDGGVADPTPPDHRYNFSTHYDGSQRPGTMPSPGGMLLRDVDLTAFDASFFNIGHAEAAVMDPQQRQLLEVTYECLENSGVPLGKLRGTRAGCVVANNAVEYEGFATHDREDNVSGGSTGFSRSILSNRISHYLDIQGPSISIDTACSGTLVGVDLACRYLQTNQADGMLVGGALLYLDPSALQDTGPMKGAFSPTGQCHTFDADADGYIRGEAISCVYLKRLDDAIRDGDPIRAVIRGSATNSDGNTTSLTQPSSAAQAAAIRMAYSNAGISDFNETGYLECHGTGTPTGDPLEVAGLASVFAPTRPAEKPLIIGSIKSNVGHSESAAGLSGLIKTVLTVERGVIPGTPTFIKPTPRIDFDKSRVRPSRRTIRWPQSASGLRRASVNSFGFGGTNAHVVLEARDSMIKDPSVRKGFVFSNHGSSLFGLDADLEAGSERPYILALSANDKDALETNIQTLSTHLGDPAVGVKLSDVAYTLSERRTHHFHRGFVIADSLEISSDSMILGKKKAQPPRVAFIFTGQGAQWSQMGRDLIESFPLAKATIQKLDAALQTLPNPPQWSLVDELCEAREGAVLRLPEFSQPLVTALQIAQLTVLSHWGISATRVLGHSSGEIAAAVAAGLVRPEEAIKIAYLRGLAAKFHQPDQPLGMLAVGVSAEAVAPYLETEPTVQIACFNSPTSLTLSGQQPDLVRVCDRLKADGHFARMLQVNLAYHSEHIRSIAEEYHSLLKEQVPGAAGSSGNKKVTMFSSVTGKPISEAYDALGPDYWRQNMVSPVRFAQAASNMLSGPESSEFLIEIGPAGALAGPVAQVIKAAPSARNTQYVAAAKRGADTLLALYETAGKLWANSGVVDLAKVNGYDGQANLVVDLPNYQWNHSRRYWRESLSASEFLQRPFLSHDLLGSKILSVPWHNPTFYQVIELSDVPWLRDHKIGDQVIFPAAGYLSMAVEAIHQTTVMTQWREKGVPKSFAYCLKDVRFLRSLVLEEDVRAKISLALIPLHASPRRWYNFRVRSLMEGVWVDHCDGLVRIDEEAFDTTAPSRALEPLAHPEPGAVGYKSANAGEFSFGPAFQRIEYFDWIWGSPETRAQVTTEYPVSAYSKQSEYPVHPVAMDCLLQLTGYSIAQMQMNALDDINCVPVGIEGIVIPSRSNPPAKSCMVRSVAHLLDSSTSQTYGSRFASAGLYDPEDRSLVMEIKRIRFDPISSRGDQSEHVYMHFGWNADVSLTDAEGLNSYLAAAAGSPEEKDLVAVATPEEQKNDESRSSPFALVQRLLDALAHRRPEMAVLEANLDSDDSTCLWLDLPSKSNNSGPRSGYSKFHCVSKDPKALSHLQETHNEAPRTTWDLVDMAHPSGRIDSTDKFDLILVKSSDPETTFTTPALLSNIVASVSEGGMVILLNTQGKPTVFHDASQALEASGLCRTKDLSASVGGLAIVATARRVGPAATTASGDKVITCFRLTDDDGPSNVLAGLKDAGWAVNTCSDADALAHRSNILVVDELFTTVASRVTAEQWKMLQTIIRKECNVLWVTKGGQMEVTEPDRAAAPGLLRTIRSEELGIRLISLDVENPTGPRTLYAIEECLRLLQESHAGIQKDSEFVERGGVIFTPRLLADPALNAAKHEPVNGRKPQMESLQDKKTPVCLGVERVGTIDSLHYAERSPTPLPIKDGYIEIEIHAAGVNFKDLALTLGIVNSNDPFTLGGEAAGVVSRIGKGVPGDRFVAGQRVVAMFPGSFGNRIQVPWQVAHAIPDRLSFEEAATLPVAFLTAMHGLFDLGNLQAGQRVLIHSATGGTGSAAVQLCQHMGAEIFATAGTEEKRRFLQDIYNIPADHIFSSRTTDFEHQIMRLTGGLGVDVILNSLTGDLLEASWNIIAHGGTMVEIGKKDIMEHSRLSMEPFSRSASFRALDLSLDTADLYGKGAGLGQTVGRLFERLFSLLERGHVRPITPMQTFAFGQVTDALALMRSTKHMGKLVLSRGPDSNDQVAIRPAQRLVRFRPDATYLLVGGLKGICGSLAVDFAKKGAKHLAALSRSNYDDPQSQIVLRQLKDLDCQIDLLRGDITKVEDVRRVFAETTVPVAGIIQGAMVLRDRPFANMTVEEYHAAAACKIQGTWNLHNCAQEAQAPLDFFTILSSISSVLGNPAQGNYASGCSFQDAFSSYRQELGLPASTVNLGIIEQIGYMARNEDLLEKNVSSEVAKGINERLLCKIIGYSILQQSGSPVSEDPYSRARMVTGLTMPQPPDSMLRLDARFAALFVRDGSSSNTQAGGSGAASQDVSQEIKELNLLLRSKSARAANLPQVVDATLAVVSGYLVRAMRLSEAIEPERSLSAYGIDSLAAVEFRNWLRLELGAAMSVIDITTAPSLLFLAEKIITKVDGVE
uniref:Highly reducing polyketide synthase apmlA n=2 Tax=Arthrinium phaeospermum TaxID=112178 RepID=APMLA_ARTPE|nr:RecName: Full=Highly reducing polyketide synthase apmlA; Short=HRPKS apmlA; AltName: Full=Phaeospelide A biosynthesis cluster protein apmlA [Arthrinium phaeospermum]BBJ21455.1 highly reducing polyketide synthase [Arthrinium phaeospermum]